MDLELVGPRVGSLGGRGTQQLHQRLAREDQMLSPVQLGLHGVEQQKRRSACFRRRVERQRSSQREQTRPAGEPAKRPAPMQSPSWHHPDPGAALACPRLADPKLTSVPNERYSGRCAQLSRSLTTNLCRRERELCAASSMSSLHASRHPANDALSTTFWSNRRVAGHLVQSPSGNPEAGPENAGPAHGPVPVGDSKEVAWLVACPNCSHELSPGDRFCSQCGTRVRSDVRAALPARAHAAAGAEGDRRHAAMLVADISGYTEICAALDPEETREWLRSFFETADGIVHQSGGHVIDHAGDALVACFGAPVALGDDATRAVRAAAMLHDFSAKMMIPNGAPLQLHSGVALGEVVTGHVGMGLSTKFSVVGHALNVAARLSAAAHPGVVLVSEPCLLATEHEYEYAPHDDVPFGGDVEPIKCSQLQARRGKPATATQMVGRDREVALLDELLRARSGPTTVTVVGPAGIGKSRLLAETAHTASARGWGIEWMRFEQTPWDNPLARMVQRLLRDASLEHGLEATEIGQLQAMFGIGEANRAPAPGFQEVEWKLRYELTVQGVLRLLKAAAAQRPMLLLLEDIHVAATHVLDLVRAIFQRLSNEAILVLATTRHSLGPTLLGTPPAIQSNVITLTELSADQCWKIAGVENGRIAPEHLQRCIARAGGNPLYLGELLKLASGGTAGTLPASLRTAIQARVDRLDPSDRELLECAAVLGPEFTRAELSALARQPVTLQRLIADDFLQQVAGCIRFTHSLINEAVYASVLRRRRRELHCRAAEIFRARDLPLRAHHLAQAGSPEAAAAYLAACDAMLQAGDAQEAIRLAERGQESAGADTQVGVLLALACAQARRDIGDVDVSIDILRDNLQVAQEGESRAKLLVGLAECHRLKGSTALALDALAAAESCGPTAELLARLNNLRGNLHFADGAMQECRQAHERALTLAREVGDRPLVVSALSGLGDAAYAAAQYGSATEHFGAAVELARSEGLPRHEITSLAMQALCLFYVGRVSESRALSESALEQALSFGVLQVELVSYSMWGIVHAVSGGHTQVLSRLPLAIQKAAAAQAARFEVVLQRVLSDAQSAAGQKALAYESCLRALELSVAHDIIFARPATLGSLARLAPDAHATAQWLQQGFELLGQASTTQKLLFCTQAIFAAVRLRDRECTERALAVIQAACDAHPCAWSQLQAQCGRALLAYLAGRDHARTELTTVRAKFEEHGFVHGLEVIDQLLSSAGDVCSSDSV